MLTLCVPALPARSRIVSRGLERAGGCGGGRMRSKTGKQTRNSRRAQICPRTRTTNDKAGEEDERQARQLRRNMEHQHGKVKRERENASAGDQNIQMPEGLVHGNQVLSNSNGVGDGTDRNVPKRKRFESHKGDSDSAYNDHNGASYDDLGRGSENEAHAEEDDRQNPGDHNNTDAQANNENHTRVGDGKQEEKDGEGQRPRREAKERGEETRRTMLRDESCGAEGQDEEVDVSHRQVDSTVETPGIIVAEYSEDLARKVWAKRPNAESVDAKFVGRNSNTQWGIRIEGEPELHIRTKHSNTRFMKNLQTLADGTQDIEQAWNQALLERNQGFRVKVHKMGTAAKEDEIKFTMFFPFEPPSRASIPSTPLDGDADEQYAACAVSPVSSTSTSVEPTASHASLSPAAKVGSKNHEKMRQRNFIDSLMEICQDAKKWNDQREQDENLEKKCKFLESRCRELEGKNKSLEKELEEKDTKLKIIQNASR